MERPQDPPWSTLRKYPLSSPSISPNKKTNPRITIHAINFTMRRLPIQQPIQCAISLAWHVLHMPFPDEFFLLSSIESRIIVIKKINDLYFIIMKYIMVGKESAMFKKLSKKSLSSRNFRNAETGALASGSESSEG